MQKSRTRIVAMACLCTLPAFAQPAPASQDAKMKWFREAKFGSFIHWGLYAIPAGEWKASPSQESVNGS